MLLRSWLRWWAREVTFGHFPGDLYMGGFLGGTASWGIFFKVIYFIYLFLATLGLRCCARALSSCGEQGPLFMAVRGLLIEVASRCGARALGTQTSAVVACGLSSCGSRAPECRLSSCGTRAQLLRGMWDPPGPGPEPLSPALAGGFLTTVPPGKPTWGISEWAEEWIGDKGVQ